MEKTSFPYLFLFITILIGQVSMPVCSQTPFDEVFWDQASQIEETIRLFTDRSIFAVDETVHFEAAYSVSGPVEENSWSSVMYLELITSSGNPVTQGKYRISGGRATGTFHIPRESLTGVYYVKCYTRWMRNRGPGSFIYKSLKVINPFRPETVAGSSGDQTRGSFRTLPGREGVLEVRTGSGPFHEGDQVVLQLQEASGDYPAPVSFNITVVPDGAVDLQERQFVTTPAPETGSPFMVRFLPDLGSGISISGTVIGPDQNPVPYSTIHFSLLGNNPDFFASMSDENGRFVITTTAGSVENNEFFVTPETGGSGGLEVRIDQEYDTRQVPLSWEPFQLTDVEKELSRKIALNMQLDRLYQPGDLPVDQAAPGEGSDGRPVPFYGTGVKQLLIKDYVMLPNLEEVFINLVPEVQFYRKQGKNRIRIISENKSISVYNPLIMIDHISVFDHEALLALSPEKIERIDLINDIYLKGNVAFGGVLAIYSTKGDMAGIDLPKGSYFFDYQSIHHEPTPLPPLPEPAGRLPDTRNTIFWSADLTLEQGSQLEIPIEAPARPGSYIVLVRGISPGGRLFSATTAFTVE